MKSENKIEWEVVRLTPCDRLDAVKPLPDVRKIYHVFTECTPEQCQEISAFAGSHRCDVATVVYSALCYFFGWEG